MATIHISQDEAERHLSAFLSRVDDDTSFLIERDSEPVAILQAAPPRRLSLDERIARLQSEETALQDDTFASDVDAAIERHRAPLDSSIWD